MKRTYNIPLRKAYINKARYRKTPAAVKAVKAFLMKHMKAEEVKLGKNLNNSIWANGIKNPPSKVSVEAEVKDGVVYAELVGVTYYEPTKADFEAEAEKHKSAKEKLQDKLQGKEAKKEKHDHDHEGHDHEEEKKN